MSTPSYTPAIGDIVHGMKNPLGTLGVDCFLGTYVVTDICLVSGQIDQSEKYRIVVVRFLEKNAKPFGNPLVFAISAFCSYFDKVK